MDCSFPKHFQLFFLIFKTMFIDFREGAGGNTGVRQKYQLVPSHTCPEPSVIFSHFFYYCEIHIT